MTEKDETKKSNLENSGIALNQSIYIQENKQAFFFFFLVKPEPFTKFP